MLVTIICPVYNASKYLNKCLRSIVNQTFVNWELIVVDDCGSDNSMQIVNTFQKTDDRIKVIHHEHNLGVDQARFTGLAVATGEYVMFVDADDWLPINAVNLLFNKIIEEDCDLIYGGMQRVLDNYGMVKSRSKNNYTAGQFIDSITNPILFDDYFISFFGVNILSVSMCAKIYKREVIIAANLHPTFMKMGEDLMFNMKLFPHLTKIGFVTNTVYFYRFGGMTSTSNPTFLKDIKFQYLQKAKVIEEYNYVKAIPFIRYELINCFYSHFYNLILLDKININTIRGIILLEFEDKIYHNVSLDYNLSPKALAIRDKNVDAVLAIVLDTIRKQKNIHTVKKIISKLIN